MKKTTLLILTVAAVLAFGCKSKKKESASEGSKNLKAASASIKTELGFEPSIMVSVNLKSAKKSQLWEMFKGQVAGEITKKNECFKAAIDSAEGAVFIADKMVKKGKKSDPENGYVAIIGVDGKAIMECAEKKEKDKVSKGKLNGQDAWIVKDDGENNFVFISGKNIAMVSEKISKKVTPGKGTLGKIDVANMIGSKTITLKVSGVQGEDIESVNGYIDISSGINANLEVGFSSEDQVKGMMKKYEGMKAQAPQMPIPGIADMLKNINVTANGKVMNAKVSLTDKHVAIIVNLAKSFGGGLK